MYQLLRLESGHGRRLAKQWGRIQDSLVEAIVRYANEVPLYYYFAIPHRQERCDQDLPDYAWWDAENQIVLALETRDDWRPDSISQWIEGLHAAHFPHDTEHVLTLETRQAFSEMASAMCRGKFRSEGGIGTPVGLEQAISAYRELETLAHDPPWPLSNDLDGKLVYTPTLVRFLEQHRDCASVLLVQHSDI